jgi:hypothetical protein
VAPVVMVMAVVMSVASAEARRAGRTVMTMASVSARGRWRRRRLGSGRSRGMGRAGRPCVAQDRFNGRLGREPLIKPQRQDRLMSPTEATMWLQHHGSIARGSCDIRPVRGSATRSHESWARDRRRAPPGG